MKILFCSAFFLMIFSCSAPSSQQEKNNSSIDSSSASTSLNPTVPDTAPHPSAGMKKFVEEAVKAGFQLNGRIRVSDQKKFFGLIDPSQTFSYLETGILAKTPNACTSFSENTKAGMQTFEVEEWSFASQSEAELVEHALAAPVKEGTERFVRTPFTFWRIKDHMYFMSTPNDKARSEMDRLNNMLVESVSFAQ